MKNIYIEGIQGMGKSTLVNGISAAVPGLHVYREGDYSPADLAWCAWMTKEEYGRVLNRFPSLREEIVKNTAAEQGHFVVTYTKIRTEVPGFYQELEQYEIYNGRKSFREWKTIIFERYRNFRGTGCLFECAFFQNIIEDLILFHQLGDEEIVAFYRELFGIVDGEQFRLLYLYSDDLEETIERIKKERCDEEGNEVWYRIMLEYLRQSPYGRNHGCAAFGDLIAHFRHRQQLELRIIREVLGDKAAVIPAKEWKLDEIMTMIA